MYILKIKKLFKPGKIEKSHLKGTIELFSFKSKI
jgi:hypothetical protein